MLSLLSSFTICETVIHSSSQMLQNWSFFNHYGAFLKTCCQLFFCFMSSADITAIIWFAQWHRPIACSQVEFNFTLLALNHTLACHKAVGTRYSHHYHDSFGEWFSVLSGWGEHQGLLGQKTVNPICFMNANMKKKAMLQLHQWLHIITDGMLHSRGPHMCGKLMLFKNCKNGKQGEFVN